MFLSKHSVVCFKGSAVNAVEKYDKLMYLGRTTFKQMSELVTILVLYTMFCYKRAK